VARAEAARKHAEEALSKISSEDVDVYEKLEIALKRSNLRLDAVKRHRSGKRFPSNEG
jgi:F0F1-type ATP synthase epsilon subunit